jgi:hypothetical protein
MLGYRKRSFAAAHAMLQTLRAEPEDLVTLKELQKLLLGEIIRAEEKIRELKTALKAIDDGEENSTAARQSSYLEGRIEGFRKCAFIWRCFGDAIAFLYMEKHALKHTFFSTENTNAKQVAGFIGNKEGLGHELALIDSALEHNVPALLVDLTNTIRHGDICLMGESDPHLIEVKASKTLDSRGKKQKSSLKKLRTFYQTDKCEGLRGFPELRRQSSETPERTYVDQLNECIIEAGTNGWAVRQPERGLHYIIMTASGAGSVEQAIASLNLKPSPNSPLWVFFLNEQKSGRTWAPYLPFVLSIESKDNLWDFIRGDLFIYVLVELDALCQIAREKGYEAKFEPDDEAYALHLQVAGGDGETRISKQLLMRIGMEFVSPEWVVLSAIEGLSARSCA